MTFGKVIRDKGLEEKKGRKRPTFFLYLGSAPFFPLALFFSSLFTGTKTHLTEAQFILTFWYFSSLSSFREKWDDRLPGQKFS